MAKGLFAKLFALLLSGSASGCADSAGTLQSTVLDAGLTPVQPLYTADAVITVRYFLHNRSDAPVTLLPWGTPLEKPLTADCFDVFVDGRALPYKRMAPGAADHLTLAAGQRTEAIVELSPSYDMRAPGRYTVKLKQDHGVPGDGWRIVTEAIDIVRE